ncbi:hypothetical protein KKH30_02275 [Candidatus Micrarchaeota archaeon]|nr:hypothetical protein [Candidatus Micrarchaeota archaeon]MBU1939567.1 hypothetical protein [Candidatus Micrarchaeota archaeon]
MALELKEKLKDAASGRVSRTKEKLSTAKLRIRQVRENNDAKGREILNDYAKEKIQKAKADKRYPAIYILEIFLILIIIFSIAVFVDAFVDAGMGAKMKALLSAASASLGGENTITLLAPPYSYIAFAIVLAAVFFLYRYTLDFRKAE